MICYINPAEEKAPDHEHPGVLSMSPTVGKYEEPVGD
jgi:hypothetical protein